MQVLSWHSNWNVIFMRYYLLLLVLFISGIGLAQQEFHVFPVNGESKKDHQMVMEVLIVHGIYKQHFLKTQNV